MAALGLTAAVLHARETGEGQFMDVAMYDSIVALCEAAVYRFSYAGFVTKPTTIFSTRHPRRTILSYPSVFRMSPHPQ